MPTTFARVLFVSTLWIATAHADAPTRTGGPMPADDAPTSVAAELGATGNLARGLTRRDLFMLRGVASVSDGPWSVFVQPYWLYGDVNHATTDDELYVRAAAFRALGSRWFAFTVTVFDHSLHRDVRARGLAGGGVGATLVRRPGVQLVVSAGIVEEIANYNHPELADGSVVTGAVRDTTRASVRIYGRYKLGDRVAFVHDVYVMPALADRHDTRVVGYTALDLAVVGGLSARVAVDASHEDVIVAGTQHDDLALTFGVAYAADWRP